MEAELNIFYPEGALIWGCERMRREVLLNTGSTIDEGRLAKGGSKLTEDYTEECAVCEINLEDFLALGSPEKVKVSTEDGMWNVAVYAHPSDSVMPGHVFMPRAIWSNLVVASETFSTGSPLYKGSPVYVEPTEEEILSAEEIVFKFYVRGR